MNQTTDFELSEIERLLISAGASADASEAHGAFCGRACLAGAAGIRDWQQELLADADADNVLTSECARALELMAAGVLLKLEAGDMQFSLLLPGDDDSIESRTAALADWCHGLCMVWLWPVAQIRAHNQMRSILKLPVRFLMISVKSPKQVHLQKMAKKLNRLMQSWLNMFVYRRSWFMTKQQDCDRSLDSQEQIEVSQ